MNIICEQCGNVIFEDGELTQCEHYSLEETIDFYNFLQNKYAKKEKGLWKKVKEVFSTPSK